MVEKNHGHVVAISSIAGYFGAPYGTLYCPSKFAVRGKKHTYIYTYTEYPKKDWIYSIN